MEMLAAIRERREEIARAVEALTAEDNQLATTESVLQKLLGQSGGPASIRKKGRPSSRPGTQREMVLQALAQSSQAWLRTRDLIDWAAI